MKTMTDLKRFEDLHQARWYWLLYITGSLCLLGIALYFQYVREEQPCLMCIQVRLLFTLLIIIAVAGLLTRNHPVVNALINISTVLVALSLTERSYQLLGTERGFVFSDCGFDLGLPSWLAVDAWLPSLYRVETTCGYTPEILFGITTAEALIVFSILLLLFTCYITLTSMIALKK